MKWPGKLFHRRASREALLNEGLALAMDWGDDWLSPINARLHERHRYLGADELAALNSECQGAMRCGHEIAHARLQTDNRPVDIETFARLVRERHSWVSQENATRLLNQSVYYAAKTGRHARGA